jgi:hypothetical protein
MRETLEAWGGLMLAITALGVFLACPLLWIAAKYNKWGESSGAKHIRLRRILLAAVTASILIYGVTGLFLSLMESGAIYGFFLGLILTLFLFKGFFRAAWKQTFIFWVCFGAAQALAVVIGAILFVGGIADLLKIL